LFNVALEKLTVNCEAENNGILYNKYTRIFAGADYLVIVGRYMVELKDTMKQLMKAAHVTGFNMQKTMYIEIT
jgi:hypothetical protein